MVTYAAEVWIYQAFEVAGRHADLQLVDDPPACDDLENNDANAKTSLFLVKGPVLAYSGARYPIAALAFRVENDVVRDELVQIPDTML